MHLHLLIHLQNKQNSSQKHAAASRNKTCSLVWDMLVVHVENSCKNDIQIPKTFCLNSSTSKRIKHSFATCKWIPNLSFLPKTSINNSSCTKTSCIPKIHQFQMFSHHSASFPEFCSTTTSKYLELVYCLLLIFPRWKARCGPRRLVDCFLRVCNHTDLKIKVGGN